MTAGWWRPRFTPVSSVRVRCAECAEEMDVRANTPQRHLLQKHGVEGPKEEPPPSEGDEAQEQLEASLKGLSRNQRLQSLLEIANKPTAADRDRIAAEGLIAKYQGWLDAPPDEDEEESRKKHVDRYREALRQKGEVERRFKDFLQDRETRAWVLRRLVTTTEEMEWARNTLDEIEREATARP